MNSKGSVILIVLISVICTLLVVGGAYLGLKTVNRNNLPTELKDVIPGEDEPYPSPLPYLEYTHPDKGFSFEYPSTWLPQNEIGDVYAHTVDFIEGDKIMMNLEIINSPFIEVLSTYPDATEIVVGDKKGLKDGLKIVIPLGLNKSAAVLLEFQDLKDQEHILSTFQFGDQSAIDEVAQWPIYENKKYGFSFSYPSLFKIEESTDRDSSPIIKVIYDKAPGLAPVIPQKVVLEAKVVKTSENAALYAESFIKNLKSDPNYKDFTFTGVQADQINFNEVYKVYAGPKNSSPYDTIAYYFINLKGAVLEAKFYYPNTINLKVNNGNIMDQIIYKIKLQK